MTAETVPIFGEYRRLPTDDYRRRWYITSIDHANRYLTIVNSLGIHSSCSFADWHHLGRLDDTVFDAGELQVARIRMREFLDNGVKEIRDSTYPGGIGQFDQDQEMLISAYLISTQAEDEPLDDVNRL